MDFLVSDQNVTGETQVQGSLVPKKDGKTAVQGLRLLIVEDDAALAESLRGSLADHGFRPTVANSTKAAWEMLHAVIFDLIVLDVGLPEGNDAGFELAQRLRETSFRQPILFLSCRSTLADRVRGLKYGDDYLTKPYELPELVARLEALSRRGSIQHIPEVIRWRKVDLFPENRQVYRNGKLVTLTVKEYAVLELFMLNPGRFFSSDEVLERVWGTEYAPQSNIVAVHIKNVRDKLGKKIIEMVRGYGYRFRGS